MGRKSKLSGALDAIKAFFDSEDRKVFSEHELKQIYYHNNRAWNLPDTMSFVRFMDRVGHQLGLLKIQIEALEMHSYTSEKLERYLIGDPSVYEIALSLRGNSYLSHYSSMFLHGLTQQIPKNIYISFEQSEKPKKASTSEITQSAIDNAFTKPQRESSQIYRYGEYSFILLTSKNTGKAGISKVTNLFGKNLPITNLERTIIDITVRPNYAGGVTEVIKAYQTVKKSLSINKLIALLKRLDYIYPYQQAIGFYCQKAGYRDSQMEMLVQLGQPHNFYLTYHMSETDFSETWKIYYPKNL